MARKKKLTPEEQAARSRRLAQPKSGRGPSGQYEDKMRAAAERMAGPPPADMVQKPPAAKPAEPREPRNRARSRMRAVGMRPVHTDPPGPATAGGSAGTAKPTVVSGGRGRYLVPVMVGAGVLGGAAYLASRRKKRSDVGKAWTLPDGEVVVVKADKRSNAELLAGLQDDARTMRSGQRHAASGTLIALGGTSAVGLAGAHALDARHFGERIHGGRTAALGGLGAAALAGGIGQAVHGGRKQRRGVNSWNANAMEANRRGEAARNQELARTIAREQNKVRKGDMGTWVMPDGEIVEVSKSYPVAWPPQRSTAVTPRTPSGPHVGTANNLKRIKGKGSRTPRTKLLVIGRGSGHGRRISKSGEGWNTFGGGRERTPALSRNGIWG